MQTDSQLVFIIGRSRSGTTLLRTILDSHLLISIPNECPFILQLSKHYKKTKHWTPEIISSFIFNLKKTWLFDELKINLEELEKNLLSLPKNIDYSIICKTVLLHTPSAKKNKELKYIGDKNPSYSLQFGALYNIFGNQCKYIFLNRDYRDQFVSLKKVKIEIPDIIVSTKRWVNAYTGFKKIATSNSGNFHMLRYEDLVLNPEKELIKVCTFMNIPYSSEMLNFFKNQESLSVFTEKSLKSIHYNITLPLHRNSVNVWEKELSKKQIGLADKIAGKYASESGYKQSCNMNSIKYFFLSLPGNFLYCITLFSSHLVKILPFNISLKVTGGAFLGNIWNRYLRKE
jgi:hypothetical protein